MASFQTEKIGGGDKIPLIGKKTHLTKDRLFSLANVNKKIIGLAPQAVMRIPGFSQLAHAGRTFKPVQHARSG